MQGVTTRSQALKGMPTLPLADIAAHPTTSRPGIQSVVRAMAALVEAVNCTHAEERDCAREYVTNAYRSLDSLLTPVEMNLRRPAEQRPSMQRGGLAAWQIRRVSAHIDEHLSESITCEDLALLARLSVSHFARGFRKSLGCPPHAYLMKRRIERAQDLLVTTNTPLGQIALECGLADQSHLSRVFRKFLSETPLAWRRARMDVTAGRPLRSTSP
jgi:AraC family transcriptional regulator